MTPEAPDVAQQVPASVADLASLLPLERGGWWQFESSANETSTLRVLNVSRQGQTRIATLLWWPSGASLPASSVIRVQPRRIDYEVAGQLRALARHSGAEVTGITGLAATAVPVTTTAGRFDGCLQITTLQDPLTGAAGARTIAFAPGVGPVQIAPRDNQGITWRLKSSSRAPGT